MQYDDYIGRLAQQVRAALDSISAHYAFDYGPEFEIAVCKVLSRALPGRVGVCRGFVVDRDGTNAGDDIIVFDRLRFPALRLLEADDFSRKESVPIEAAYAYIEAKHTLHIDGDGPQSLAHALAQVEKVRTLVNRRATVRPGQVMPLLNLNDCGIHVAIPAYLPPIANPFFTMIIARNVKKSANGDVLTDGKEIKQTLQGKALSSSTDLIVAGENVAVVPVLPNQPSGVQYKSVFYMTGYGLHAQQVDGLAFGIAIASLWTAIEWIQLGRMHWHDMIAEALGAQSQPE
jgi:hypothetical protein